MNLFAVFDLTIPRLKRTLFLGTRWGEKHAKLVPAPGDPFYLNYTYKPMDAPLAPPPPGQAVPADEADALNQLPPTDMPMPPVTGPVLPLVPPTLMSPMGGEVAVGTTDQVFAGPFAPAPAAGPTPPGGR